MMFKGRHFDRSVILLSVRWYLAYNLSLRKLEEMMAERGISVAHATVGRWVVRYSPELLERFNRRKRPSTKSWYVDETYIKVRGRWMYLYRAIDSNGETVEFWFSERRYLTAAILTPPSAEEPARSSPEDETAQAGSEEDVRVKEGCERRDYASVEVQPLGLVYNFGNRRSAIAQRRRLESIEVGHSHPAMAPHLPEKNFSLLKVTDEVRTGHV
jgi:transposase-like protein